MAEFPDLFRWSRRRLLRTVPAVLAASAVDASASGVPAFTHSAHASHQPGGPSQRSRQLINADWRFFLGDASGAEAVDFEDRPWQPVSLPHSFGVPYFARPGFYVGYGWYRKHLALNTPSQHHRISLEFEAAFQDAEIFVNGKLAGRHIGGYTGFSLDITGLVRAGDNLIAARVNNLWNPQLNPRGGEHQFNGGIYRNVYLVTTASLHVAWYGTFITTPGLTQSGSVVRVATEIRNTADRPRQFLLVTDILNRAGHTVATVQSQESIAPAATATFEQLTPHVSHPDLWSPAQPNLYSARTRILEDRQPLDEYTTTFGFRWFRWTAEHGFFLNGEHHYFHGADVHQDHAGWCDAVPNTGIVRDVSMVKQAGMDFIRGSHYPHSPVFSDACDRLGILLWSENCFWGTGGLKKEGYWSASAYPPNEQDQRPFEENVKQSLREMIRIHRNHPSIVVWSLGNEVFFSDRDLMPKVRGLVVDLVKLAHSLDPSRPAGLGGVQRGKLDHLTDVAGYNGDGAKLFIDPGVPNAVTEYGSDSGVRPGQYSPGWGDMEGQPQFEWRSGQALWCAFDHGSIFGPSMGQMGMVDYFRLPKMRWYWYRNAYAKVAPPQMAQSGTPAALGLRTDLTGPMRADGTGDAHIIVSVFDRAGKRLSDSPPVRLEIVEGPGEFPTGRSIDFAADSDIVIRDGEAAIELHSCHSGTIRIRATSPGLQPAELSIVAEGGPAFIPGVTPVVASRPYVVYPSPLSQHPLAFNISVNRPTASSSSLPDHLSRLANDGDRSTYWQPLPEAPGAIWWQVDFESLCFVDSVHLSFVRSRPWRYRIEYRQTDGTWTSLIDRSKDTTASAEFSEQTSGKIETRFLRVVLLPPPENSPIQLQEVVVYGEPVQ